MQNLHQVLKECIFETNCLIPAASNIHQLLRKRVFETIYLIPAGSRSLTLWLEETSSLWLNEEIGPTWNHEAWTYWRLLALAVAFGILKYYVTRWRHNKWNHINPIRTFMTPKSNVTSRLWVGELGLAYRDSSRAIHSHWSSLINCHRVWFSLLLPQSSTTTVKSPRLLWTLFVSFIHQTFKDFYVSLILALARTILSWTNFVNIPAVLFKKFQTRLDIMSSFRSYDIRQVFTSQPNTIRPRVPFINTREDECLEPGETCIRCHGHLGRKKDLTSRISLLISR